ncbi:response regulator transcription factor [Burkholderia cepacia]|uniref:response regulator transcription factor n=1 Tax=Burkholderia cepacia TaxID=292 RepID=UPI0009BF79B0|nr:response regulator transcription factor [Burkholderia cepacia]
MKYFINVDAAMFSSLINVIVADNHPVVVMGVVGLLKGQDGICLTSTAGSIDELIKSLAGSPCDVLICDFKFDAEPTRDGTRLIEFILKKYPKIKIIIFTAREELSVVRRVLEMGVAGFIGKSSVTPGALPCAVRAVYSGGIYLDQKVSRMLGGKLYGSKSPAHIYQKSPLTTKEYDVVRKVVRGMSLTDIAKEVNRSIKTISTQKIRAMEKLGAKSDIELGERFKEMWGSDMDD